MPAARQAGGRLAAQGLERVTRRCAVFAANLAVWNYHYHMPGSLGVRRPLEQRLALLKQQHLELLALLSRSHESLAEIDELKARLEAVDTEMAKLESALMPPRRKIG